jgi:hypothetical protein
MAFPGLPGGLHNVGPITLGGDIGGAYNSEIRGFIQRA